MAIKNQIMEESIDQEELANIIDIEALQSMMDDLYAVTKIGFALIDLRGNVLAANGWQDICTKFHRKNPQSLWNCLESDLILTKGVTHGEFRTYKCKNNMWDIVTPVIIGDKHVANLFSGQFFFDDESIDRDLFAKQAEKYGLEKKAYLEALDRVPKWNRTVVQNLMRFYAKLAEMISKLSYSNLRLSKALSDQKRVELELRKSHQDLKHAQAVAKAGNWRINVDTNELLWSEEAYRIFGIPVGTHITYDTFLENVHPNDRERVDDAWKAAIRGENYDIEHRILIGEKVAWVREKGELEFDKNGTLISGFGTVQDITEQKNNEKKLQSLNRTLRAISDSNQALMRATDESVFLQQACRIIIEDCGHTLVWIGFAEDNEEKSVKPMAYAGFDKGYIEALKITWADTERGQGPTGRAIRTGKPQICSDMKNDPDFAPWRKQALERGYRSSIVLPLLSEGKVFGALNIYSDEPNVFSKDEVKLLSELASDFSHGIMLIRMRSATNEAKLALQKSEYKYRLIVETAEEGIWLAEPNGKALFVNQKMADMLGYKPDDIIGKSGLDYLVQGQEISVLKYRKDLSANQRVQLECQFLRKDGEILWTLANTAPIFDQNGEHVANIAMHTDITKRKMTEQTLISSNQRLQIISDSAIRLLSADDPEKIVNEICKKVMAFLNLDVFFNFLVDENKGCLHLNAYSGIPKEVASTIEWLQFGEAVCGCAAKQGERIICENIGTINDKRTTLVNSFGVKAYVATPLISKGKVIGTLSFGNKSKASFTKEELELINTISAQVSLAMERKQNEKKAQN